MSRDSETARAVAYWPDKAEAALASVRSQQAAGRGDLTVSRACCAAFHAEHIAELLSILRYREVYGESPPAAEVSHAKAALAPQQAPGRPGRQAGLKERRP